MGKKVEKEKRSGDILLPFVRVCPPFPSRPPKNEKEGEKRAKRRKRKRCHKISLLVNMIRSGEEKQRRGIENEGERDERRENETSKMMMMMLKVMMLLTLMENE